MANFLYAQTTPLFLLSRLGSLNPHFDMSRYLEKFGRLETNLDRVNFVYKDLRKFKLFPKSVKCGKSDAESQGLRERGNEAFGEGGYRLALERYTASLAAAKGPGFLALAFANRSACLYKLGRFQECLTVSCFVRLCCAYVTRSFHTGGVIGQILVNVLKFDNNWSSSFGKYVCNKNPVRRHWRQTDGSGTPIIS